MAISLRSITLGLVAAGAAVALSGCIVVNAPDHHPSHCRKVRTKKRVCVKRRHNGHCKVWRVRYHTRWVC